MSSSNRDDGTGDEDGSLKATGTVDRNGDGRLATSVLRVLDTVPEFDAKTTDGVLADFVDPDALDSLFRTTDRFSRDEGHVVFPVGTYQVTVTADDEILVRDRA